MLVAFYLIPTCASWIRPKNGERTNVKTWGLSRVWVGKGRRGNRVSGLAQGEFGGWGG